MWNILVHPILLTDCDFFGEREFETKKITNKIQSIRNILVYQSFLPSRDYLVDRDLTDFTSWVKRDSQITKMTNHIRQVFGLS